MKNRKRRKASKQCSKCFFGEYLKGSCPLASGWICKKNPFRPVAMGLLGECSNRKENKKEQYSKKL